MKRAGIVITLLLWCIYQPLADQRLYKGIAKIESAIQVYNWSHKTHRWALGPVTKRITEFYDQQGRLVQKILANGDKSLLEKTLITYSDKETVKKSFGPDKKLRRTVVCQRKGNKETETAALPDGDVLYVYKKQYDDQGTLIELKHYNAGGTLLFIKTYTYLETGDPRDITLKNPDGSELYYVGFIYESRGHKDMWTARRSGCAYHDVGERVLEFVKRTIHARK